MDPPVVGAKRPHPDAPGADAGAPAANDVLTRFEPDKDRFQWLLQQYYKKCYPFQAVFEWLSYGDAAYMRQREWSYTKNPDIYLRYRINSSPEEFAADVQKIAPDKIDIGGHYNKPPVQGANNIFVTEKELVFDIDMDDYNSVKGCGCMAKAQVCARCWSFMSIAVEVVDRVLRNDFGFRCILWVFSGRRGMHCWVADSEARKLSNEVRQAITDYMAVIEHKTGKTKLPSPLPPTLRHMYDEILLPRFKEKIIPDHELFENEENIAKVFALLPPGLDALKTQLLKEWSEKKSSPVEKWNQFVVSVAKNMENKRKGPQLQPIEEIVFTYTWPRLDANVSKDNKHLLKAPFCVHPSTQRVCVPVDPKRIWEFNFETVPRVQGAVELDVLGEHVKYFRKEFLEPTLRTLKKEAAAAAAANGGPTPMDW